MSDEQPVDELTERRMLEALEALENGEASASSAARPYLEALGMLPQALEPLEPSASVKQALLAQVDAHDGEVSRDVRAADRTVSGGGSRWMLRLAAVLAVALLAVSASQYFALSDQERQIDRQAAQIERLQQELAEMLPAASRPPDWMVSSGTELCALSPRQAATETSKGWLFVRQDHQHWYVAVEGLEPSPEGHVYELWFLVDGELVSGGTFHPDTEGRAVLTSETMPNPVTGIAVTLEPDNGDGVPSETMVLYGDEVMLVL